MWHFSEFLHLMNGMLSWTAEWPVNKIAFSPNETHNPQNHKHSKMKSSKLSSRITHFVTSTIFKRQILMKNYTSPFKMLIICRKMIFSADIVKKISCFFPNFWRLCRRDGGRLESLRRTILQRGNNSETKSHHRI